MEKFKAVNDEGIEVEYDILLTFDSDKTNKSYIVYTDGTKDSKGHIIEYVSSYDIKESEYKLEPITDDEEWKMLNSIINALQEGDK